MIVNLYADSPEPESLRTQINASLAELVGALNDSLVGEVIRYTVAGRYPHSLGVVPILGLVTAGTTLGELSILPEKDSDWTDTAVIIPTLTSDGEVDILLLGKL